MPSQQLEAVIIEEEEEQVVVDNDAHDGEYDHDGDAHDGEDEDGDWWWCTTTGDAHDGDADDKDNGGDDTVVIEEEEQVLDGDGDAHDGDDDDTGVVNTTQILQRPDETPLENENSQAQDSVDRTGWYRPEPSRNGDLDRKRFSMKCVRPILGGCANMYEDCVVVLNTWDVPIWKTNLGWKDSDIVGPT